jgi:hypothetical protein
MSLKITIEINLEHEGTYSETEAAVIAALTASPAPEVIKEPVKAAAAATAKTPPAPTKPAAKVTPPGKPAQSTRAAVLEDIPDAGPEEAEEDLVGGEAAATTYTMEDAVSAATKLVSGGKSDKVKAALAKTSAKRVSELKGDDLSTFMEALGE